MVGILIDSLSFTYSGLKEPALQDINLKIPKGTFMLITGPSGCGKSTLVDCINGLIPHRYKGKVKGAIYIDGKDWFDIDYQILCQKIGLVRQNPDSQLACEDVRSEVAFGPENICLDPLEIEKRVDWALKSVDAFHLKDRRIKDLSGGEKQRIAIASMLVMKPEVLILDEPSSFLDVSGQQNLYKSLISLKASLPEMTLIVVDHELFHILFLIDYLVVMENGKILIQGEPGSLLSNNAQLIEDIGVRLHPILLTYFKTYNCTRTQPGFNNQSQFNFDSLNKIFIEKLKSKIPSDKTAISYDKPLLELHDVSFNYSNNHSTIKPTKNYNNNQAVNDFALKTVNLKIYPGEFICVMGNNGSGKTTLLRILAGQFRPTSGAVFYQNSNISNLNYYDYASHVGIIFQNPEQQFFKRTVLDEIYYGPDNFGITRQKIEKLVENLIFQFKLDKYSDQLPFCLSWGEKRRVNIASILSYLPNLLLLDEIFIGQDLHTVNIIIEILQKLNQRLKNTIIITSHKLDIVMNMANRAIILDKGNIILDGSIKENFDIISDFFYNNN